MQGYVRHFTVSTRPRNENDRCTSESTSTAPLYSKGSYYPFSIGWYEVLTKRGYIGAWPLI